MLKIFWKKIEEYFGKKSSFVSYIYLLLYIWPVKYASSKWGAEGILKEYSIYIAS